MNKQEAMKRIEAIEAEAAALRKLVQEEEKPQGLWRPNSSGFHYYLGACLNVNEGSHFVGETVASGNCFPTREAAEKAAPLFARAHKIIQAALMADPEAGEWSAARAYTAKIMIADYNEWAADDADVAYAGIVFVHTRAQAEHMAAILNAEGV